MILNISVAACCLPVLSAPSSSCFPFSDQGQSYRPTVTEVLAMRAKRPSSEASTKISPVFTTPVSFFQTIYPLELRSIPFKVTEVIR